MELEEIFAIALQNMENMGAIVPRLGNVRKKGILGGCFDSGDYRLCSIAVTDGGLDRVHYFVADSEMLVTFGVGDTKSEAMALARELINVIPRARIVQRIFEIRAKKEQEEAELIREQKEQWQQRKNKRKVDLDSGLKKIPKRRQQVFDASSGKCHYCETALDIRGKWHVEHKMPRALMGGNEPSNLVASCTSCNHKKRDQTDVEFMAMCA